MKSQVTHFPNNLGNTVFSYTLKKTLKKFKGLPIQDKKKIEEFRSIFGAFINKRIRIRYNEWEGESKIRCNPNDRRGRIFINNSKLFGDNSPFEVGETIYLSLEESDTTRPIIVVQNEVNVRHKATREVSIERAQSEVDSLTAEEEFFEGGKGSRLTNYYERIPKLRAMAVEHHGTKCKVCGFDFGAVYGERGKGYIEVHHLVPVSTLSEETKIDPKVDMTVLCANCHRMIHHDRNRPITVEELKGLMK